MVTNRIERTKMREVLIPQRSFRSILVHRTFSSLSLLNSKRLMRTQFSMRKKIPGRALFGPHAHSAIYLCVGDTFPFPKWSLARDIFLKTNLAHRLIRRHWRLIATKVHGRVAGSGGTISFHKFVFVIILCHNLRVRQKTIKET